MFEGSPTRAAPRTVLDVVSPLLGVAAVWLVVAIAPLSACGGPTAQSPSAAPIDELPAATTTAARSASTSDDAALDRGAAYLAGTFDKIDAVSLAIIDYVGRRFGLEQLATARSEAERRYPNEVMADDLALQRLVIGGSPPPTDLSAASPTTRLLATALHCDRRLPGQDYPDQLRSALQQGGFEATHAALALGWLRELGCSGPELSELSDEADRALRSGFDGGSEVVDLRVEQAAFREYLTSQPIDDAAWIDALRAAQRPDGGWGQNGPSSESSWHTTVLAMWDLAAATTRSEPIAMIASA